MKRLSRLRHAATGLLSAFVSRDNDIDGYWALGMLYREVSAPPHIMVVDLRSATVSPDGPLGTLIAVRYGLYLTMRLRKLGLAMQDLETATVTLAFNVDDTGQHRYGYPEREMCTCTVTLADSDGRRASHAASVPCVAWSPGQFAQRGFSDRIF